jgi:putative ABC transport system ATP-binding protein
MAAVAPLSAPPLIELVHVSKDYDTGGGIVRAMRDVSLSIHEGEMVAIVGTSGSGKSTMMNILGCLDRPTRGTYSLAGIDVEARTGDSRAIVRNRVIGFIFQGFNLLARTTALENVELPLQYRGVSARERRRRAKAALEAVGLGERLDHTPNQLSGGQQQRVAIARALVTDPPLLLADEPTGNLDTRTSLEVLALLQRLNRTRGITVIIVTHERDIAACASRVVTMRDGRIVSDAFEPEPLDAAGELARLPRAEDASSASTDGEARDASAVRPDARVPPAVYAVLAAGMVLGAAVGLAYGHYGLRLAGPALVAVAVALAEILAAWMGARWLRRRLGRPASSDQRVRVALVHTGGSTTLAAAVMAAFAAAVAPGRMPRLDAALGMIAGPAATGWPVLLAVGFASLGALGLMRYLLLSLFNQRR